jgi:hypothetical protein
MVPTDFAGIIISLCDRIVTFSLTVILHQLMLVADIEILCVHVVIGFDFMNQNKCVIDVSSRTMQLNNQCIPCQLESQVPSLFRITVRENVTILSRTGIFVYGVWFV